MNLIRSGFVFSFISLFCLVLLDPGPACGSPPLESPNESRIDQTNLNPELLFEVVVAETLKQEPQIQIQQQVVRQLRGAYRSAHGEFDLNIISRLTGNREFNQDALAANYDFYDDPTITTGYQLSLQQKFITGTVFSPYAQTTRTDPYSDDDPTYTGKTGFKITQPLLRNAGSKAVGAGKRAAGAELSAAREDLIHRISSSVRNVVEAYGNYLAALQIADIRQDSLDRMERLYGATEELVNKDEMPESDLNPLRASRASKRAQLLSARQQVEETRSALGLAIGIPEQLIVRLGVPENIFSRLDYSTEISDMELSVLIGKVIDKRSDYQALEKQIEATRYRLDREKNNLHNPLDLEVDFSYKSGDQVDRDALYYDVYGEENSGLNVTGNLTYSWPVGNDQARGEYEQRQAQLEQQLTRREDLLRRIKTKVRTAYKNLATRLETYRETNESVGYSRDSLEAERRKHRLGMSTVLDVIDTEERLTGALLDLVEARRMLLVALVELRFQSGLLLEKENGVYSVSSEKLLSMKFE